MLADTMLDNAAEGSAGKKVVTPAAHREAAAYLQSAHEMSERRACRVIGIDRTSVRYRATRADDGDLRERLKVLLDQLRRRELLRTADQLSKDLGLAYIEPVPGERIQGVYRRPIDLAGRRYALIENSREFALVPWRPVLEKHIDRHVSGIARGGDVIDWTIGRQRGLSI